MKTVKVVWIANEGNSPTLGHVYPGRELLVSGEKSQSMIDQGLVKLADSSKPKPSKNEREG